MNEKVDPKGIREKIQKKLGKKKASEKEVGAPKGAGQETKANEKAMEVHEAFETGPQFDYPIEELNKISHGYIKEIFSHTKCPSAIAFDIARLEKHCYELAVQLFYFHDTNSPEFRELVLDVKKLFDKAAQKRIELYKKSK